MLNGNDGSAAVEQEVSGITPDGAGRPRVYQAVPGVMPLGDLTPESVSIFWQRRDPRVLGIAATMESTERWTLDHCEEIHGQLAMLQRLLEEYAEQGHAALSAPDVMTALAYIRTGKAFSMLSWMGEAIPPFVADLLHTAGSLQAGNELAALLVERFQAIERFHVLSRVFCPESRRDVLEILEELRGEILNEE